MGAAPVVDEPPVADPSPTPQGHSPAPQGHDLTRALLDAPPGDPTSLLPATSRYALDNNIALEDIDRLFAWTQADPEGAKKFLGWVPTVSPHLHEWFQRVVTLIGQGKALLAAVHRVSSTPDVTRAEHVGFIMLLPIVRTPGAAPVGTVHIFVAPAHRGDFLSIVQAAVDQADRVAPGITLFIQTASAEMARLFESLGFESGFHLYRLSHVKE